MKKLFFCAAALLAAISFAACSDDDDQSGQPVTPESIAGTWQIVNETGRDEKDTWSDNYPDEDGWYYTITFNKDGSMVSTLYADVVERHTGSYSIFGNTLTMQGGYDESDTYEIRKLTQTELVLFCRESDFEETTTFKRIK